MIYSVFAGMGKTYLAEKEPVTFLDLESSDYQWEWDEDAPKDTEGRKGSALRKKNPQFPDNYVRAIEHASEELGYHVFISSQSEVLKALENEGLPYITVTPGKELKQEYIERYETRGNPKQFVELMENNFDNFVEDMSTNNKAIANYIIRQKNTFLSDILGGK